MFILYIAICRFSTNEYIVYCTQCLGKINGFLTLW